MSFDPPAASMPDPSPSFDPGDDTPEGRLAAMEAETQPGPPMTLANMRSNGVRMVTASCEACGHKADVNVDALPESVHVPEAGRRLRCSRCGAKTISTRPAWRTRQRQSTPDLRAGRPPMS